MADGDDDEDDDEGDDGDEGEEGEEGDGTPAPTDLSETGKAQDQEMADAVPPVDVPAPAPVSETPDVEMTDSDIASSKPIPPNPFSLAPPSISLAGTSPRFEGSPLKNVVMPSPTTEFPPEIPSVASVLSPPLAPPTENPAPPAPTAPAGPLVKEDATDIGTVIGSTIAEPPSTIGGDVPEFSIPPAKPVELKSEPQNEEALLPPPPDQVGNIATTPTNEEPGMNFPATGEDRLNEEIQPGEEAVPQKPPLFHRDTDDTIKPEDSASAIFPLTEEPAAPSDDVMEDAEKVEEPIPTEAAPPPEPQPEEAKPASPPKEEAPVVAEELDLLQGLMGELDRQSEESKEKPAPEAVPEPVPEPAPEPAVEATPSIAEPETVAEPPQEPADEPADEPMKDAEPEQQEPPVAETSVPREQAVEEPKEAETEAVAEAETGPTELEAEAPKEAPKEAEAETEVETEAGVEPKLESEPTPEVKKEDEPAPSV